MKNLAVAACLLALAASAVAAAQSFDGTYIGKLKGGAGPDCAGANGEEVTLIVADRKIHLLRAPDNTAPVSHDGTFTGLTIPNFTPGNPQYISGRIVGNTIQRGRWRATGGCSYGFTATRK